MVKNLVTLRNKLAHSNQPLTSKANIAFIKLFCRFPLFACIWQRELTYSLQAPSPVCESVEADSCHMCGANHLLGAD